MLKERLCQHLTRTSVSESTPGWVSISQLSDLCPRQVWLCRDRGVKNIRVTEPKDELNFAVGRSLDDYLKKWLTELNLLIGYWYCPTCNSFFINWHHTLRECPRDCKIGAKPSKLEYVEPKIIDSEFRLRGKIDGAIRLANNRVRVLEYKKKDPGKFYTLKAPEAPHVVQVSSYLWCLSRHNPDNPLLYVDTSGKTIKSNNINFYNSDTNTYSRKLSCRRIKIEGRDISSEYNDVSDVEFDDMALLIYACAGYTFGSPFKEFTLRQSDSVISEVVKKKALMVQSPKIPPESSRRCSSPTCVYAQNCPVADPCFA